MITNFRYPSLSYDVFAILHPCHMLTLARNSLADVSLFLSSSTNKIEWRFIKELHKLQLKEGLKLGNKLLSAHIQHQKNKINVSVAAQT